MLFDVSLVLTLVWLKVCHSQKTNFEVSIKSIWMVNAISLPYGYLLLSPATMIQLNNVDLAEWIRLATTT